MKPPYLSPVLVMSLKRLLVGSISLSEDSQDDEENGEEQSERPSQEMDSCQSTGRFRVSLTVSHSISCSKLDEKIKADTMRA